MGSNAWLFWALASAGFASLTAVFAKMGLQGIDSDFAAFIRTLVILAALVLFLTYTGKWQGVNGFTGRNRTFLDFVRTRHRRILARLLQSPATGQRPASRARRQIQPGLGRADGGDFLRRTPEHAGMDRLGAGYGGVLTLALKR
ncbi:hypothetical protein DFR77_12419 [Neisseria gonorrhoeae]|nr:hypothetical protein DFR77_12419 [Neisseria gonorrhoeae]